MIKHKLDIIEENDYFIAVNKPAGLLSIPDRLGKEISLKQILMEKLGQVFVVHRLDKGTSGLIVFAKDAATHKLLSVSFEERTVQKYYLGLVYGSMQEDNGTVDAPIMEHPVKDAMMMVHAKGKPSLTEFEVLEKFNAFSWVKYRIYTGRTHQIRVHSQHIGHSIVCDEVYGDGKPILLSSIKRNFKLSKHDDEERPILSRLGLHSSQLSFELNDTTYHLEANLPKDLSALLQQLRKRGLRD